MLKTVTGRKILIIEDDLSVRKNIAYYFKKRGNIIFEAETLTQARQILNQKIGRASCRERV